MYFDGAVQHGFLLIKGQYFTVDPPDSTQVGAFGINNRGEVSGWSTGSDGVDDLV